MRTATTTPTHDARHCGHVARSESAAVKRARILFECEREVPGFTTPADEPSSVMALLSAMRQGVGCDRLAHLVSLTEWHAAATEWADAEGDAYLLAPTGGLSALLTPGAIWR